MRLIPTKRSSGFLLAIVALLFAASSATTYAQSRAFQMALWTSPNNSVPTVKTDVDIASFYEGENQPPGRSILIFLNWTASAPLAGRHPYDWSRIVAVEVDEPYRNAMGKDNPCVAGKMGTPTTEGSFNWYQSILAGVANQVKALAPKARFWVNYSKEEMDWAISTTCSVTLNYNYIDVISMDDYGPGFQAVFQTYYQYFFNTRATPWQQIALLPQTSVRIGADDPATVASVLQDYLTYANNTNRSGCNLALGPRGVTGFYDRCPVWIVMGYLAGDDGKYSGLLDPGVHGDQVDVAWHQELALPLLPALARQLTPGQIMEMILPGLSNN